ncbi:MAG: TIGR02597 family protein, partial [Verrucomicrobiales bacterium]|nr:TIGR02597 family protein [Verrucomicrobiales bacterium]
MSLHVLILTSLLTGWASSGIAQTTSSTPPIGFIRKDCPANSDTRVSIPLERQAVYIGPVQEASSNVITVQGSPWTDDEFKFAAGTQDESYYVLVLSGANAGRNYDVTSNSSNTLTVDVGTDSLDSISIGDRIKLLPHWTLKSAFPNGSGVDASPNGFQRRSELLVQDNTSSGINLASIDTFYYSSTWKGISSLTVDAGNEVLPPHRPLVIRNSDAATSAVFVGVVPSDTQTVALRVPAGD